MSEGVSCRKKVFGTRGRIGPMRMVVRNRDYVFSMDQIFDVKLSRGRISGADDSKVPKKRLHGKKRFIPGGVSSYNMREGNGFITTRTQIYS